MRRGPAAERETVDQLLAQTEAATGFRPEQITSWASSIAAGQRSSLMQSLFLRWATTSPETLGDRHDPLNLLDTVKRTHQPGPLGIRLRPGFPHQGARGAQSPLLVIPAEAGIHIHQPNVDARQGHFILRSGRASGIAVDGTGPRGSRPATREGRIRPATGADEGGRVPRRREPGQSERLLGCAARAVSRWLSTRSRGTGALSISAVRAVGGLRGSRQWAGPRPGLAIRAYCIRSGTVA